MKRIEMLDKYVVTPNVGFYGGFVYDGEDIFLCDDHDTDEGYDCTVRQEIRNGVMITDLVREYTTRNDKKVKETSRLEVEIEKGQLLVYVEGTGYTIPEYRMCKVDEAIGLYDILRGEQNDVGRDEAEGTGSD